MNYSKFTKKELVDILDVVDGAIRSTSEEDIRRLIFRMKGLVSGDLCVCGIGSGADEGLASTPRVINGDYPLEWLNIYGAERLYLKDPIIWHNFQHPGSQLWEDTYRTYGERVDKGFVTMSKDFGLTYGVSGGMFEHSTGLSTIFTFSSRSRSFTSHERDVMNVFSPHLHQALVRVHRNAGPEHRCRLSKREREVITWMKEGKTNWEISVILNISERTVKFHVQNIERKLNAVNKAHAIAIAMEQNLVF